MKTYHNGMVDQTDIKIFILYLLDAIDYPLEYEAIHDIVLHSGYVGPFDFAECFSQLMELGHILSDTEGGETYYIISSKGKMIAAELQSKLLLSIREKSLKCAMRYLSFQKRKATRESSVTQREDGKYVFHCEIRDPQGPLLDLDLCMASRLQSEAIQKNFDKEPEEMYRRLLTVLTEDMEYTDF